MPDRSLFRIGGISAIVGGILGMVFNVLHPRTTEFGEPEAFLRVIAESPIWVGDHIGIIFAVLLTTGGLVAIYRSITTEPAMAWARLGMASALIGAAVSIVLLGSDGIAAKALAAAWANAPAAEKSAAFAAAFAIEQFNFGLFSIFIVVYFGVTVLLYGLAVSTSAVYPKVLGWVGILDGLGAALTGLVQAYNGPSVLVTNVLFPIFSVIATLWVVAMGVLLWQRAGGAAQMR